MPPKCWITPLPGAPASSRRAIAFLEYPEEAWVNALSAFERRKGKRKRDLRARFDYWIQGNHFDKYFHGFNKPGYENCFVFKLREAGTQERHYGFLCNPLPQSNPGLRLCVLVLRVIKNEGETDYSELDRVNRMRESPEVRSALLLLYSDQKGVTRQ